MRKCVIAVFDTDVDQCAVSALNKDVPVGVGLGDYIIDNLGNEAWETCSTYDVDDFVADVNECGFGTDYMAKAFYVEEDDDAV